MKKLLLLILTVSCLLFASCTQKENTEKEAYITFTDDAGHVIELDERPKKVAVLFSSYSQMVLLSGGSVDVTVGESIERGFVDKDTFLVDDGAGKNINTELLLAQNCDFVIGSLDISAHNKTSELLTQAGVPNALFKVESFEDYDRIMGILCDIFENEESYVRNVERVKDRIDNVLSQIPQGEKKKILFVRCASTSKATKAKTAENNFVCRMLKELNTQNIAENAPLLLDGLSIEEILLENPDYIFFSTMGDENAARQHMMSVLENKEWQMLSAVKGENYTFLDKNLFQYKPNNRWDEAYQILAELLYGE